MMSGPEEPLIVVEEARAPTLCEKICACVACLIFVPVACISTCIGLCCCLGASAADSAVHHAQGKRWDGTQGKWVIDRLEEEATEINKLPKDDSDILKLPKEGQEISGKDATSGGSIVKETEYYDTLGVPTDATESKIKRAYYIEARKWHPDRNNSPEAKVKFQAVGEAYQVLSDEKLRKVYDRDGKDGLSGDKTEVAFGRVDPSLIFTFLFGNDAFDDIIGRLKVVTQTIASPDAEKYTKQQMMELDRRRVVRLAVALRDRIQCFVDGDVDGAKTQWKSRGEELVEVRYGEQILNTVGTTYKLVAKEIAGSFSEGLDAQAKSAGMTMDALSKAAMAAQIAHNTAKSGGSEEDSLPAMVEVMWNMTVIDISSTLREVVIKVLKDQSVSKDIRKKRAKAIEELGIIWEVQKKAVVDGRQESVRRMFASATAAAMEAALSTSRKDEEEAAGVSID